MLRYETISPVLAARIQADQQRGATLDTKFGESAIFRRNTTPSDKDALLWPPFVQDINKILHCPYYNRYTDKTQVFSLLKNDDITRRSLHVQLVSRIARTIGSVLNLNLDLIEAISLGHDLGHTPFAHSGEVYLNELYHAHTGRYFSHSIHSVRVLDGIFPLNLSLQTLDGIACHNGEIELPEYHPVPLADFREFDRMMEACSLDNAKVRKLMPSTLEGAVVRIADIIAYLGKDRQDAARIKMVEEDTYTDTLLGSINGEIINNLMVNIIENSYGKPYIKLDDRYFAALKTAKKENYSRIYESEATRSQLDRTAKPMMGEIYGQLLQDLLSGNRRSPIFLHHIDYINHVHYHRDAPYALTEPNQIVVDYIASMTDDYFIDLHHYLFPDSSYAVTYTGYFDDLTPNK